MCWFCIDFFSQNTSFFIKLIIFILLVHGRNPRNLYPPTNIWEWNPTISKMSETWESHIIQIFPTHFRFCRIHTQNFVFVKPTPWNFDFLRISWSLNFQYLRIHTSEKLCLSGLDSYMKWKICLMKKINEFLRKNKKKCTSRKIIHHFLWSFFDEIKSTFFNLW